MLELAFLLDTHVSSVFLATSEEVSRSRTRVYGSVVKTVLKPGSLYSSMLLFSLINLPLFYFIIF